MPGADEERMMAGLAAVQCFYACDGNLAAAVTRFKETWNAEVGKGSPNFIRAPREFIQRHVDKLAAGFDLHDAHRSGRPVKVPDATAKQCAAVLAKGYWQLWDVAWAGAPGGRVRWCEHKQYTSLAEALQHHAGLRAIVAACGVSEEHLIRRMHEVDPDLQYMPLFLRFALSPQLQQERMAYCTNMLRRLAADPGMLSSVVWIDECRIWVNRDTFGRLCVWQHRSEVQGQPPLPNPMDNPAQAVDRVDMLLAVSAQGGVLWQEFLTGTTAIDTQLRHNASMQAVLRARSWAHADDDGSYKTKASKYTEAARAATSQEFADNLECMAAHIRAKHPGARGLELSCDNARIHSSMQPLLDLGLLGPGIVGSIELPAHSPDLHQVIEHLFGELKLAHTTASHTHQQPVPGVARLL